MVFSSLIFLWIFLPLTVLGNLVAGKKLSNLFLLAASLFFYAWGEPVMVLLMIFSIIWNWLAGCAIGYTRYKKFSLFAGVTVDLSFLIFFKYLGLGIPLPIGISFFTFQAISYLADVYRKVCPASKDPLPVALYISFFPQLIAGPIVQYFTIEKELKERRMTLEGFSTGFQRFIFGLGKKVLIANILAECADAAFNADPGQLSPLIAWIGALSYTLQIYYDFSGYSDMALGLGKMFGFSFPENFRYPYISKSITEFWRRWHITLGSWFREYLYIPLGGNRKGKARTYVNLFIVFFLTGLWHGADLSFVIWGLYHGILSLIERAGFKKLLDKSRIASRILCFVLVLIGWVFFRADNTAAALKYLGSMFYPAGPGLKLFELGDKKTVFIMIVALLGMGPIQELIPEKTKAAFDHSLLKVLACGLILLLSVLSLAGEGYNPFIYFQF